MKIDSHGCVVMESGEFPGTVGDSCAETGRLVVLKPTKFRDVTLNSFITDAGFVRHPESPWREDDFTSDQMQPLLMALILVFGQFENKIPSLPFLPWKTSKTKRANIAVILTYAGLYRLLGVTCVVQMAINLIPFRWHDGHQFDAQWSWFRRKFWRFTSSKDSTVSFLTTASECIFLKHMGITYPLWFMNKAKYLRKIGNYYRPEPNRRAIVHLYRGALCDRN